VNAHLRVFDAPLRVRGGFAAFLDAHLRVIDAPLRVRVRFAALSNAHLRVAFAASFWGAAF
jgi:hypothetical protein